jgi:hypothetical protein
MRKVFLSTLFAFALGIGAAQAADVVVKIAPPHAIVEHRDARPSREHVWISGYHRWDGNHYVWEKGHWEKPPHRHAKWHDGVIARTDTSSLRDTGDKSNAMTALETGRSQLRSARFFVPLLRGLYRGSPVDASSWCMSSASHFQTNDRRNGPPGS